MNKHTVVAFAIVTVLVSAVWMPAYAQQNKTTTSQQAAMLLEIQALRSEIAELRDMVDRQGYQLRRMQKAANNSSGSRSSNSVDNPTGVPNYTEASPAYPAVQSSASNYPTPTDSNNVGEPWVDASQTPIDPTASSTPAYPAQQPSPASSTADLPADDADFYNPYENNQAPSAAPVSAANAYPPVEERRVGVDVESGDNGVNNGVNNARPSANNGSVAPQRPVVVNNTQPNGQLGGGQITQNPPVSTLPNAQQQPATQATQAAAGTGVIAVPAVNATGQVPITAPNANGQQQQYDPSQVVAANAGGIDSPQARVEQAPQVATPALVISEQDYYQKGFGLLKQSNHAQAVDTFKKQIVNYPQGDYADDAHYWIAESMYVNRSLDNSKLYFKAIMDNFSQSPRLPDAMLKTAYIEQEQGNQIEARILLQEIIQYHPRSNAAISAKNRLTELSK
jgi:tol-pal system protein YbgF